MKLLTSSQIHVWSLSKTYLFDSVATEMLFKGLWFATGLFWTSPLGGADWFAPLSRRENIIEPCKIHLELMILS